MTSNLSKRIRPIRLVSKSGLALFYLLFAIGITACDKNNSEPDTSIKVDAKDSSANNSLFKYIEVSEKIDSPASPLGYWDKNLRYPQIIGLSDSEMATNINKTIIKLVEEYKCSPEGEQGFESEVTFVNKSVISFKYDAMWMCDSMPGPDSVAGAATIDLSTGKIIVLADELIDMTAVDKLKNRVAGEVHKLLQAKNVTGADCPETSGEQLYYLTKDYIVFRASFSEHSDSACEVEAKINLNESRQFLKPNSKLLVR